MKSVFGIFLCTCLLAVNANMADAAENGLEDKKRTTQRKGLFRRSC